MNLSWDTGGKADAKHARVQHGKKIEDTKPKRDRHDLISAVLVRLSSALISFDLNEADVVVRTSGMRAISA